jgi:hypothetical protein
MDGKLSRPLTALDHASIAAMFSLSFAVTVLP